MNRHLPTGWSVAKLSDVADVKGGVTKGRKLSGKRTIWLPYLRVANVQDGYFDLREIKTIEVLPEDRNKYGLRNGDLLFTEGGDRDKLGRGAVWHSKISECIHQNHIFRARVIDAGIVPEFISLATKLDSSREYFFNNASQTVNLASINLTTLAALEVPVAPSAEQCRIVAKIETVRAKVEAARERLNRIPVILKRFRQAILAAACTGRLTADWRTNHLVTESASLLLAGIQRCLPKPTRIDASGGASDSVEMEEIPESWSRCTLSQLFAIQTGGTPLKSNPAYHRNGTIPWVRTGEVQNCDIWRAEEHITPVAIKETNVKVFPEGTLLIAMYGEGKTRGQVGRLRIKASTNQACAALVNPQLPTVTNDYVFLYALAQYQWLRAEAVGGNQPNLSLGIIKMWEINLPPLDEQAEIVRRVKEQFALVDRLEKRYAKAKSQVDKLTQAVLAKAFRGELVSTEAELARSQGRSYETADELLARISEEKRKVSGNARPPRRKRAMKA